MSKIQSIVQHVLDTQPHTHGNNTELCVYVWHEVCMRRNVNSYVMEGTAPYTNADYVQAIRDYPPESITRKRREIKASTKAQHEKGYNTWKHFATGLGNNPLD